MSHSPAPLKGRALSRRSRTSVWSAGGTTGRPGPSPPSCPTSRGARCGRSPRRGRPSGGRCAGRSPRWRTDKLRIWPSAVRRVRSQAAQNGRVTEAIARRSAVRAAVHEPALGRGRTPLVDALLGEREARPQRGEDVARGDHALALPAVLGVQGHLLDEAQLVVVLHGPGQQVGGLVVIEARHQDAVDLDRGQAGVARRSRPAIILVAVSAGEGLEDIGAQGAERDVHPVPGPRSSGRRRCV